MFRDISRLHIFPDKFIHLWNVTYPLQEPLGISRFKQIEYLSFYSLLFLVQSIGEENAITSASIGIVSNNLWDIEDCDILIPEKSILLGPCKVIPQEYPKITCKSIDVSSTKHNLPRRIIEEFFVSSTDSVIAYRGKYRWVQKFKSAPLEKSHTGDLLREKGTYLISGGLGGIGLETAKYLAKTVHAKLVLLGYSEFPIKTEWNKWLETHHKEEQISQRIQKIKAIEQLGSEVLILQADIGNQKQVNRIIKEACRYFGSIHGVIHASSIPGGGTIQLRTVEKTEEELMKIVPKEYWFELNTLFVLFGQKICQTNSPLCSQCPIKEHCPRINVNRSR